MRISLLLTLALTAATAGAQPLQPTTQQPATAGAPLSWPTAERVAKAGSRWWWMGSAVSSDGLERNMRRYAEAGLGTLEVTPIYGVQGNAAQELSFLSTPWMDALRQTQALGHELDIDIDMNCGTGWPFGGPTVKVSEAAGKLVTRTELLTSDGTTALTMSVASPESNAPLNKVMAYQDGTAIDVTAYVTGSTLSWTPPSAGQWRLIAVYNGHTGQQVKRAAPGGEGLVLDHYDSTAVANYLKRFDQAFEASGVAWPHAFFNDSYEVYGANWTPTFFDAFARYRSYRLEDHLPRLLGLEKDTDGQVMADYRETLSDLLLDNFTRQWTRWAHSHGVLTRNQGHGSPGNLLDFYAAVDIPEIEGFGLTDFGIRGLRRDPGFVRQNLSDFSTLKYASSAAHVMGKALTSSETFTWLTEHFRTSLSQMKPDLDLMFCAGVNHMLFHGTTYSPPEAAWPGWKFYAAIDMSPTNSIWADAPELMAYIERCQSFLQMGRPDNDVLVYAPFLDVMHKTTGTYATPLLLFDINTLSQKMSDLTTCVRNIEAAGLDCDYVSDRQLLDVTLSADGQLVTAGGTRYSALVVPASKYMPAAVRSRLDSLATLGATIVWGNKADLLSALPSRPEALRTQLGLRLLRRSNDTGHHYFMANLSKRDVEGWVTLADAFQDAAWFDPLTGAIARATVDADGRLYVALRSGQSAILQTYDAPLTTVDTVGDGSAVAVATPLIEAAPYTIDTDWTLSLPEYSADGGDMHVLSYRVYPHAVLSGWQTADDYSAQFMGTGTYETTFELSERQLQTADAGFRLDLGDVRESARVYINDTYVGCAWSAPFTLDVPTAVFRAGANTLRVDVTNLPANHIRQMDVEGQTWRIFKDVNILDIADGSEGVSGITSYASWQPVPSGLCSPVRLSALRRAATSLSVTPLAFTADGDHYYATYRVEAAGASLSSLTATDGDGQPYTGYTLTPADGDDGVATLVMRQAAPGYVQLTVSDADGTPLSAYLPARGAYERTGHYDFCSSEPPLCGWDTFSSTQVITGFAATGKVAWCRAKASGRQVDNLYEGLHLSSASSCYYFFYPGYGMTLSADNELAIDAQPGTVAALTYVVGSADAGSAYAAALSQNTFATCADGDTTIALDLPGRASYYVYRQLDVYRPVGDVSAIDMVPAAARPATTASYTLGGLPLRGAAPRGGTIVVRRGQTKILKSAH